MCDKNMNNKIIGILTVVMVLILIASIFTIFMKEDYPQKTLSNNDDELGTVKIEGPYGNLSSPNRIAFIIGTHPLEYNSHEALVNLIRSNKSNSNIQNAYYIYIINVTKDRTDFAKGRMNGQLLGEKYVVPHINEQNYSFVVDVHSHRGVYEEYNFIIAPLNDAESVNIGLMIINNISNMSLLKFVPEEDGNPTSPDFISIPILKNGTPTLIYETYLNETNDATLKFITEFFQNLDNIDFSVDFSNLNGSVINNKIN